MKMVNVSLIEVRRKPSMPSKTNLKRGTVVKTSGPPVTYKGESWSLIQTLEAPIVKGYVQDRYLKNL